MVTVIDDNYMSMQDRPNEKPVPSAPLLYTNSLLNCPLCGPNMEMHREVPQLISPTPIEAAKTDDAVVEGDAGTVKLAVEPETAPVKTADISQETDGNTKVAGGTASPGVTEGKEDYARIALGGIIVGGVFVGMVMFVNYFVRL